MVTGATGLLGRRLLKDLSKLYVPNQLYALSKSGGQVEGAQTVTCDILDVVQLEKVIQNIDKVYHCAGVVSFDPASKQDLVSVNIGGTSNLVNVCLDAGVKKLLHVSSVAAIGRESGHQPANETTKYNPKQVSLYGKTKHEGELHAWRGFAEGLDTIIVNPSIILGSADWNQGSTQLFKSAYEEFPYFTKGIHGYIDVQDVTKAMIGLMNSDISGERYILNGTNISFEELFTLMANAFGKRPPSKLATPFMSELVWRLSYFRARLRNKKPLLTKETALAAQEVLLYDGTKILKALADFSYTPIQDTIVWIVAALKDKYNLF